MPLFTCRHERPPKGLASCAVPHTVLRGKPMSAGAHTLRTEGIFGARRHARRHETRRKTAARRTDVRQTLAVPQCCAHPALPPPPGRNTGTRASSLSPRQTSSPRNRSPTNLAALILGNANSLQQHASVAVPDEHTECCRRPRLLTPSPTPY